MSKNKLIVNVYALDATTTTADHVTRHGFGVSTRLDKPIKSTTYHWQMRPESDDLGASNVRSSIEALAQNLSDNIRSGFGGKYPMDKSVVEFQFFPSEQVVDQETISNSSQIRQPRALSDQEQASFRTAFQTADQARVAHVPEATYKDGPSIAVSATPEPAHRARFQQQRDPGFR